MLSLPSLSRWLCDRWFVRAQWPLPRQCISHLIKPSLATGGVGWALATTSHVAQRGNPDPQPNAPLSASPQRPALTPRWVDTAVQLPPTCIAAVRRGALRVLLHLSRLRHLRCASASLSRSHHMAAAGEARSHARQAHTLLAYLASGQLQPPTDSSSLASTHCLSKTHLSCPPCV